MNWKTLILGGGMLVLLRHIGYFIGFGCQIVWEGFLQGVAARKAINQDPSTVMDILPGSMNVTPK